MTTEGLARADQSVADSIPVRLHHLDPLAQALKDSTEIIGVIAVVGDRTFILEGWTHKTGGCEHERDTFETRWRDSDPGCGHRSCKRQGVGLCVGVMGAQADLLEDRAADDDEWPIGKVRG